MQNYYPKVETFQGEVWQKLPGQYARLVKEKVLRDDFLEADETPDCVYTRSNHEVLLGDHIIVSSQRGVFVVKAHNASSYFDYGH